MLLYKPTSEKSIDHLRNSLSNVHFTSIFDNTDRKMKLDSNGDNTQSTQSDDNGNQLLVDQTINEIEREIMAIKNEVLGYNKCCMTCSIQ